MAATRGDPSAREASQKPPYPLAGGNLEEGKPGVWAGGMKSDSTDSVPGLYSANTHRCP